MNATVPLLDDGIRLIERQDSVKITSSLGSWSISTTKHSEDSDVFATSDVKKME